MEWRIPQNINRAYQSFPDEELQAGCNRLNTNKAPAPENIPSEILRQQVADCSGYVLTVLNRLANNSIFPAVWKKAKLVLIIKEEKAIDRPDLLSLFFLDVEGTFC